jgi:hypothetical protein
VRSAILKFGNWAFEKIEDDRGSVKFSYPYHTHPFNRGDTPSDLARGGSVGDPDFPSEGIIDGDESVAWMLRPLTGVIVSPTKIVVYDSAGVVNCTFNRPF